jgi:hypothetical protein
MKREGVRPNSGYISAIFFMMLLILLLAYSMFDYRRTAMEAEFREQRIVAERDSLRNIIREFDRPREQRSLLSTFDIGRLRRMGLENPVQDITGDLLQRDDIIPYEGVLGGRMGFYSPENIYILNSKWVFAYVEDGHIRGEMLLEYGVGPDGSLTWNVVKSHMD